MIAAGVIGEEENFELIEGEIVPMAAKNHVHERIKSALNLAIARALPADLWLGIESSIRLSATTFVEPDLVVYRRDLRLEEVRGPDVLLVVEVADTTLAFDRGRKAQLYAAYGVSELWVVDAVQRTTWVHRGPTALAGPASSRCQLPESCGPKRLDCTLSESGSQIGTETGGIYSAACRDP